ncbi:MAG: GntR family transcriptional regulator [Hyphomicrobiales bacterium]|nr:GntR family transcriptional regulator [Hyphomicrobiales bacterium]
MTTQLRVDRAQITLRDLALDKLRNAILSFYFKPGERLVERDLCEQLGVSRSIVREALCHLEAEGLVATGAQRGPYVAKPTAEDARQIYEIRALLEAMAARACASANIDNLPRLLHLRIDAIAEGYAAGNAQHVLAATNDFYALLFESAGRNVAFAVVRSLNARINQLRAMTIATPGRDKAGISQMRRIVEAIARGDGEAAHQACIEHVSKAAEIAQSLLLTSGEK